MACQPYGEQSSQSSQARPTTLGIVTGGAGHHWMARDMASDGSRLGIGAGMGAPPAPRSPLDESRASQPNNAGAAARASGSATASISGPSDASPYEHASDAMHSRGPRSEDDEDEGERGRTLPTAGPSHTRSREPDSDEADIPIAASEAARRRHFKALRTAKACDVSLRDISSH